MKTNFKNLLALTILIASLAAACKKEDDTVKEVKITPVDTTGNDTTAIDYGPQEGDYDFYIAMSYSDPQPTDENLNRYYVLIACEDPNQTMETVEMQVQGIEIPLEYANYGGPDFYIAYFNIEYADTFHYELTMNGVTTAIDMATTPRVEMELPATLAENQDLDLTWEIAKNPQVIYIEGFQRNANFEELKKGVEYLTPDTREFTLPADWLWSEENVDIRDLYLGIMNYKIENRVCFTLSDGAFKMYQ